MLASTITARLTALPRADAAAAAGAWLEAMAGEVAAAGGALLAAAGSARELAAAEAALRASIAGWQPAAPPPPGARPLAGRLAAFDALAGLLVCLQLVSPPALRVRDGRARRQTRKPRRVSHSPTESCLFLSRRSAPRVCSMCMWTQWAVREAP